MTTFLLMCVCGYLVVKSWASAHVPAATPEEQRLRSERQTVRHQQTMSLVWTGIAWLVGKGLGARKA
jgi:hypothetical protein